MTAEDWSSIRSALEGALALPEAERLAFIHSVLPNNLRQQAIELLTQSDAACAMFPVTEWSSGTPSRTAEDDLCGVELGNYRLGEELGQGGMGTVYRAERGDGTYAQAVAITVMLRGLLQPSLAARFRDERQILARLSHPGIARLLDGGVTQDERPYLVMELVEGIRIDQYCEQQALSKSARLRLFLQVAGAVQAAHQALVLHLDLKPGNILVTAAGSARLLDFGVAQMLADGISAATAAHTTRLLTPRYASPEQVQGAPLGVASDIFSLGTLLYRLLTGTLPYPIQDMPPLEAARIICEQPPIVPSLAATDQNVRGELRGDMDAILLKTLHKDPAERYPTVSSLAEDVCNHLESRPVRARRGRVRYRMGKLGSRQKTDNSVR
jgi:serine/threonine protein kinase